MVNVQDASYIAPSGLGPRWKLTPVPSPHGHSAVETSWYFQFAEHLTSEDGKVSVKSSVVLNFLLSGHWFPGMPVSRPMKCTSIVGTSHVSVLRETRGAARAGSTKGKVFRRYIAVSSKVID